jgi:hypothetical protein
VQAPGDVTRSADSSTGEPETCAHASALSCADEPPVLSRSAMRAQAPHRGSEYRCKDECFRPEKASLRLDCRARHATALVLEAAATRAWLVAPGPRLDGSRSRWRHQPEQIIEVLRLVRLHARDHMPPAFPAECQDFFRSLEGSNSHHGWSLLATDLGHAGSLYPAPDTEPNSWVGSGVTSKMRIRCRALSTLPSSRQ